MKRLLHNGASQIAVVSARKANVASDKWDSHCCQETEHCFVFQLSIVIEKTHEYTLYNVCADYSFFSLVLNFKDKLRHNSVL